MSEASLRTHLRPLNGAFPLWAAIGTAAGIFLSSACAPAARVEAGSPPEIQLKIADAAAHPQTKERAEAFLKQIKQ